jgi:hypothetical protein
MNERIKELYKQSSSQDYFPRDAEEVYMSAKNLEKFAELIVKECMKVASPDYMSTPEDSVYYVEQAVDRIAEHFGVEFDNEIEYCPKCDHEWSGTSCGTPDCGWITGEIE